MIASKSIWMLVWGVVLWAAGCMNTEAELPSAGNFPATQQTEQVGLPGADVGSGLDEYMNSVREQSDLINASLENDPLTQTDMNMKSQELLDLWDHALNTVLGELEKSLAEEEFAHLQEEQRTWTANRETLSKEAGKEAEGGSLYPLIVNMEAARLTEERVYELCELLPD